MVSREHLEFVECPTRSWKAQRIPRTNSNGDRSSRMERKRKRRRKRWKRKRKRQRKRKKENRPEKDLEDLVADAEEEKVADAEKDEAKVEKEKWNEKWQNWNNNEGQQQHQQAQHQQAQQPASSSGQPSVRMVSQVRGNESVRRVMQESTFTIEEAEDEVVDLIGIFNNFARSSNVRMVKEVKKRPKTGTSEEESEERMPKKYQRENILFYPTKCAREQLKRRGYEDKEVKRRANVLRATWNQVKDQNDLVKEVLDFLNDYPDRAIRQEFLGNLAFATCCASVCVYKLPLRLGFFPGENKNHLLRNSWVLDFIGF